MGKLEKRVVYRYRPVNEHTLKELENDDLVLSSVDTLNDPNDIPLCYKDIEDTKSLLGLNKILFVGENKEEIIDDDIKMKFIIDGICGRLINEFKKKVLVGCFAEEYNNQAMWAHYANNRKGFVVGYLVIENCINTFAICKVKYEDRKIDITDYLTNILKEMDVGKMLSESLVDKFCSGIVKNHVGTESLTLKNKYWEYEKEWRIICFNSGVRGKAHYSIGKAIPKTVIVGDKMPIEDKKELFKILLNKKADVYEILLTSRIDKPTMQLTPISKDEMNYFIKNNHHSFTTKLFDD